MMAMGVVRNVSPAAWFSTILGVATAYIGLVDLNLPPAWAASNGGITHGLPFSTAPSLSLGQFVVVFTFATVAAESLVDARVWPVQLGCGLGLTMIGFAASGWFPGVAFGDSYGSLWTILAGVVLVLSAVLTRLAALRAQPSLHRPAGPTSEVHPAAAK